MNELNSGLQLVIALILGAVIGLEREINEKRDIKNSQVDRSLLGLRTFSLTAGLGALSGLLFPNFLPISLFVGLSFLGIAIAFYIFDSLYHKDLGITTEISLIYSFIIGFILTTNILPISLIIALTVIVILLLSRKEKIQNVVEDINKKEVNAFVSFAILATVILPFLPDHSYAISDIPQLKSLIQGMDGNFRKLLDIELFNPFKLWFIIVLVSGIDLAGYVLERTIGQRKGWLLASLVGGFISSTATTVSIAKQSRKVKNHTLLLASAVLANAVSFIPVLFLIATINASFLARILPVLGILFATTTAVGLFHYFRTLREHKKTKDRNNGGKDEKIFDVMAAVKFAGLFLAVTIASKIGLEFFGNSGFVLTSAIGAFIGIDAVVINTAQLAGQQVDFSLAVLTFIVINAVNFGAKIIYSFIQGDKVFALKLAVSLLIPVVISFIGLLFV